MCGSQPCSCAATGLTEAQWRAELQGAALRVLSSLLQALDPATAAQEVGGSTCALSCLSVPLCFTR